MRNRNGWLSLAALLAIGISAGACTDGSPAPVEGPKQPHAGVFPILFGPVALNDVATREVEFRNKTDEPVRFERIKLDPPFSADVPPAGLELQPGASTAIRFSYRPTTVGRSEARACFDFAGNRVCLHLTGEGVLRALTCAPSTVDFGNVEKGKLGQASVVCLNETALDMLVRVPRGMTGEDEDYFSYGAIPPQGLLVRSGQPLRIPVAFRAEGVPRERVAQFTLVAGERDLATIELEANTIDTAIAGGPSCDDGGWQFGYDPPGSAREKALTVRNEGADPLTVSALSLIGPDAAAFSLLTSAPFTLPPDDPATTEAENEAQVVVEFAPALDASVGAVSAQLRFNNSSNSPVFHACLTGGVGGPALTCAPGAIDFGPVSLGARATREYVCTNDGFDDPGEVLLDNLLVETVTVSGSTDFAARIRNPDGTTGPKDGGYAAGEHFAVEVTYTPTGGEGVDAATIALASNDLLAPMHETPVVGGGREIPPCDFTLLPGNLRFGIVEPGESATLEMAVQNNLDTECLINNVRIGDDPSGVYSVDMPGHFILRGITAEPGSGQLRIPVTFSPPASVASAAVFTGKLLFDISNPATPHQEVALRGVSREPCAVIQPSHIDFGNVPPGCSTIDRELSVVNVCDEPLDITDIVLNAAPSTEFGVSIRPIFPARLARGERTHFTVKYVPQDLSEDIGSVFVLADHDLDGDTTDEEPYMATLYGRGATDREQVDRFVQEDRPKVDVLWVIDNSSGMTPFQTAVGTYLAQFLAPAIENQIDFQLGVTTTGTTPGSGCPGGVGGFENGRLFPVVGTTPRILTVQTPNLAQAWANNVDVGYCHGTERGLEAAKRALSPGVIDVADVADTPEPNDGNLGFLRPDSHLAIIFLSDEQDQSPGSTIDYYNFFMSLRGFRDDHRFSAHAIVGDAGTGCATPGMSAEDGGRYVAVVEESGGVFQSICSQDWAPVLERIGNGAFGAKTRYYLRNLAEDRDGDGVISDRTNPPDIEVFVDGTRVSSRSGTETVWAYTPETNAVEFMPGHTPEPGAQIEVTYGSACLPPRAG